ncbi:MAG: peroxiredoxin-like family protein [Paracoccaceae bacterium]
MTKTLLPGSKAPALSLPLVGGGTWTLADEAPDTMTMIVVYRGLHCPICNGYLNQLQDRLDAFAEAGVSVIAISMDAEDRATQAQSDWGLEKLRFAYGLTEAQAREWDLYLTQSIAEKEPEVFAEPGLYWVLPDGTVYLMDIGTMPFARPDLDLLLSRVGAIAKGYPPRGTYTT